MAILRYSSSDMESNEQQEESERQEDVSAIPAWRRWVVQWDVSHNAIPLAFIAFTSMLKSASTNLGKMNDVIDVVYLVLFYLSCIILLLTSCIFITRIILCPKLLSMDFHHPRLMNFFFIPVIVGSVLILSLPLSNEVNHQTLYRVSFYIFAAYQLCLSLYALGEWLFGTHLTNFIHPLVFMQTIGYFLTSNLAAKSGLIEQSFAMFYIGVLFWLLVLITNFQHVSLALNKQREKPSPPFFLFIAPPAQAAIAYIRINSAIQSLNPISPTQFQISGNPVAEEWPEISQFFLYVDLFLYCLMFRLFPTFWTSKFSVSAYAYIFPLSAAATVIIQKYVDTGDIFWEILGMIAAFIACVAIIIVITFTVKALAKGTTPSSPNSLSAYARYYAQKYLRSEDLENPPRRNRDPSIAIAASQESSEWKNDSTTTNQEDL